MDKEKYLQTFQETQFQIEEFLVNLRNSVLEEFEKDLTESQQKPKCPSVGWKNFLKIFYTNFGTQEYEGFLCDIKEKLKYKTNESTKCNAIELHIKGYMNVYLEKRPFSMKGMECEAWYGRLQITKQGEEAVKQLI